jgi:hypothetical protein
VSESEGRSLGLEIPAASVQAIADAVLELIEPRLRALVDECIDSAQNRGGRRHTDAVKSSRDYQASVVASFKLTHRHRP